MDDYFTGRNSPTNLGYSKVNGQENFMRKN
jgi:hypothetical protein